MLGAPGTVSARCDDRVLQMLESVCSSLSTSAALGQPLLLCWYSPRGHQLEQASPMSFSASHQAVGTCMGEPSLSAWNQSKLLLKVSLARLARWYGEIPRGSVPAQSTRRRDRPESSPNGSMWLSMCQSPNANSVSSNRQTKRRHPSSTPCATCTGSVCMG